MYPATIAQIHPSSRPLAPPKLSNHRGILVVSHAPPLIKPPRREIFAVSRSPTLLLRSESFLIPRQAQGEQGASMAAMGRRGGAAAAAAALLVAASLFGLSARASSSEEAFVKKTVAAHDIVIFSKSYCPYCRRAKAVFKEMSKVPYVVELDQREDGQDIQDALSVIVGRRTVPQVFIKGKHLGGSDDTVEAYESGKLAELLGIASDEL